MRPEASRIWLSTYRSPVGALLLGVHDDHLCLCDWANRALRQRVDRRLERAFSASLTKGPHPLLVEARTQLDEYFVGKRRDFDLPLRTAGTAFQSDAWEALARIPYGEVLTYRQLADSLDRPEAVRAVASAIGANALSIFLPCHRVIGSNGSLTGYAGGLDAKRRLLNLEGGRFVA